MNEQTLLLRIVDDDQMTSFYRNNALSSHRKYNTVSKTPTPSSSKMAMKRRTKARMRRRRKRRGQGVSLTQIMDSSHTNPGKVCWNTLDGRVYVKDCLVTRPAMAKAVVMDNKALNLEDSVQDTDWEPLNHLGQKILL